MNQVSLSTAILMLLLIGCTSEPSYTPKPHSYPKITFPEREIVTFEIEDCPLSFDFPSYGQIERAKTPLATDAGSDCWFDLVMPDFNGRLHCSYFSISDRANFDEYVTDAFELVSKHRIKANYRDESIIKKGNTGGILYELDGPVASNLQFFLSDTTSHFFRASLYFRNQVEPDSMAPIYQFVKDDVLNLIESFEWK